ncbi:IclR family transcriptional regulator C-terminal domain-containing protein [Streptomyces kaempferi]
MPARQFPAPQCRRLRPGPARLKPRGGVSRLLEAAELRRFAPATLTDVEKLMERLGRIRRLGYSVTRGKLDPDVVGIAAPVRDEKGHVMAAASVAALASRELLGAIQNRDGFATPDGDVRG